MISVSIWKRHPRQDKHPDILVTIKQQPDMASALRMASQQTRQYGYRGEIMQDGSSVYRTWKTTAGEQILTDLRRKQKYPLKVASTIIQNLLSRNASRAR